MAVGLGNAAPALIALAITGGSYTPFNNANSYIGVGDSTAAYASSQTDLQAATNKLRAGMNATYPSVAGSAVTFQATFGTSDANWTWNEVAIFNASSAGTMLTREQNGFGTKISTQTWVFTVTITFS